MVKAAEREDCFRLPARIRNKGTASDHFGARMALIDQIADLPGIETVEHSNETIPRRVDIYVRRETSDRVLKRQPARCLCSLDSQALTVSGLSRWEKYQVLANGWGQLINDQVSVYLPRDQKELEVVRSIIRRAYDRLIGPLTPEAGSLVISTWDWPRYSRTSLQ